MGIVTAEVAFDGRAPDLPQIADAVKGLTGLPLSFTESPAEVKGNLFDQDGYLAFACAPRSEIMVYTYRAGAAKELYEQAFENVGLPIARFVRGLNEPLGTQTVYLEGPLDQEPTLFFATLVALEKLGGRPKEPILEEEDKSTGD